jgi:hypothetical protein
MLRLLNFVLCLAMIALAVIAARGHELVWWLWAGYFVVPAFWAFMAGFRHRAFRSVQWLGWLWACIAGWIVLLWQYWPQTPGFWRRQVWTNDMAARDGVSLAFAVVVLVVALFTAYRKR